MTTPPAEVHIVVDPPPSRFIAPWTPSEAISTASSSMVIPADELDRPSTATSVSSEPVASQPIAVRGARPPPHPPQSTADPELTSVASPFTASSAQLGSDAVAPLPACWSWCSPNAIQPR